MRANADMMARLSASVPPLAEAILGEDVETMQRMLKQLHAGQTAERARQEELARLQVHSYVLAICARCTNQLLQSQ